MRSDIMAAQMSTKNKFSEDLFVIANNAGPDEMQQDAAFHLGLQSLPKYLFRGFQSSKG